MNTNLQDWAELEYLSAHISNLHRRHQAARAMAKVSECFAAINVIEREIAEIAAMRELLVGLLSARLANQVTAPLATPAEART